MGQSIVSRIGQKLGAVLARALQRPLKGYRPFTPSDPQTLRSILRPGDILLVEGNQHVSAAIKYLTQSTWSHAALYVASMPGAKNDDGEECCLVEALVEEGVVMSPLSKYQNFNTRICRPIGLTRKDREKVVTFMTGSIGKQYDLKNIWDLMRYFLPFPPVPVRWRRRMIGLGSGDPTRGICSSLIAEAFQSVEYPILPDIEADPETSGRISAYSRSEILHIRHHTLFAPRDFDLSPYFAIIKPTLERGFDYRSLRWAPNDPDTDAE